MRNNIENIRNSKHQEIYYIFSVQEIKLAFRKKNLPSRFSENPELPKRTKNLSFLCFIKKCLGNS